MTERAAGGPGPRIWSFVERNLPEARLRKVAIVRLLGVDADDVLVGTKLTN